MILTYLTHLVHTFFFAGWKAGGTNGGETLDRVHPRTWMGQTNNSRRFPLVPLPQTRPLLRGHFYAKALQMLHRSNPNCQAAYDFRRTSLTCMHWRSNDLLARRSIMRLAPPLSCLKDLVKFLLSDLKQKKLVPDLRANIKSVKKIFSYRSKQWIFLLTDLKQTKFSTDRKQRNFSSRSVSKKKYYRSSSHDFWVFLSAQPHRSKIWSKTNLCSEIFMDEQCLQYKIHQQIF